MTMLRGDWSGRGDLNPGPPEPHFCTPLAYLNVGGRRCLISPEDAPLVLIPPPDVRVSGWRLSHGRRTCYVRRWVSTGRRSHCQYLHRLILDAPPDRQVDHLNGDGLDNRRSNLRLATASQNAQNKQTPGRWRGVYATPHGRYKASIGHRGKDIYLGIFDTPEEAAAAYDAAALDIYGPHAATNGGRP